MPEKRSLGNENFHIHFYVKFMFQLNSLDRSWLSFLNPLKKAEATKGFFGERRERGPSHNQSESDDDGEGRSNSAGHECEKKKNHQRKKSEKFSKIYFGQMSERPTRITRSMINTSVNVHPSKEFSFRDPEKFFFRFNWHPKMQYQNESQRKK